MIKKIGVDMDEVICTGVADQMVDEINRRYNTGVSLDDFNSYSIEKEMGIDRGEIDEILRDINYMSPKIVKDAGSVLRELSSKHHKKIYIITSRDPDIPGMKETTAKWLDRKHIPYDMITFSKDKGDEAWFQGMDCFVEDSPEYAADISDRKIKVYLLDYPYNRGSSGAYITRVKNWREIYREILKEEPD